MALKYSVDIQNNVIDKYIEEDEELSWYRCFEDFKDAKQCLLESLDKKVKWALNLNSRNWKKGIEE